MKLTIHAAEWAELINNGAPHRGRLYKMDPEEACYTVFDLSRETMPKNLKDKPVPTPQQEYQRLYYEQRRKVRQVRV